MHTTQDPQEKLKLAQLYAETLVVNISPTYTLDQELLRSEGVFEIEAHTPTNGHHTVTESVEFSLFETEASYFFLDDNVELVDRYSTLAPDFGDRFLQKLDVIAQPTSNYDSVGKKLGAACVKLVAGFIHNACGRKTDAVQLIKEGIGIHVA
mmetsp:Transcript_14457/g.18357  ORF Transcript_14457/g.18357 Transcript_14457/m.18357 type:complete len:152 (-) Transcript_14457:459-914(-)|eukprot:CAMPEP_0206195172 /NCGR_PEP_ID=MMETSP0166-20121206/7669_1 /ASSEMBLY_ACC=CAM_ASM_000260 /TAXON_ID=95228 /ORGANISM="Vannella robusta, Strain DIVA3 518/3/11/1/6" /LENGTH=151 /DNA_ID=CAMNT_0053612355 /DNA_START=467 /DNA_END=922 /DNA_ORIENTATION=-